MVGEEEGPASPAVVPDEATNDRASLAAADVEAPQNADALATDSPHLPVRELSGTDRESERSGGPRSRKRP